MGIDADVEAVLFDIDETLCEYERTPADLLSIAFDRVGVEQFFTAQEYIGRFTEFVADADDVDTVRERTFASLAEKRGYDPSIGRRIADVYAAERDHSRVRWIEGARDVISSFEGTYRLAAVTNGPPGMQSEKLKALGVDGTFETVVFAGFDTPAKPDPLPFERALETLGTTPASAIYVGNSLRADVQGAQNAGLPAIWLSDGTVDPSPTPDFVVDSLRELLDRPWLESRV